MLFLKIRYIIYISMILRAQITLAECDLRPVVLMHGVNGSSKSMIPIKDNLQKKCPGLYVKNIEIGNGQKDSFTNLWQQIEIFKDHIYSDYQLSKGFHIIAHSQGGLITRGFIQMYNHSSDQFRVHIFITLGSPHRGVDGFPEINNNSKIAQFFENHMASLAYTKYMQGHLSLAEMWNDPLEHEKYLDSDIFIPILNNEVNHPLKESFKQNLLNLKKVVYFKSSNEDVVYPADSCWMDFYIPKTKTITPYSNTIYYEEDVLGIKSLEEEGRIFYPEVSCSHTEYRTDPSVFQIISDQLGYNSELLASAPPYTPQEEKITYAHETLKKKNLIINYLGSELFNEIYAQFLTKTFNETVLHNHFLIQNTEKNLSHFSYMLKKTIELENKILRQKFSISRFLKNKKNFLDTTHLIRKTQDYYNNLKRIKDYLHEMTCIDDRQLLEVIPHEIFYKKLESFLEKIKKTHKNNLRDEIQALTMKRIFLRYKDKDKKRYNSHPQDDLSIAQILKQKQDLLDYLE